MRRASSEGAPRAAGGAPPARGTCENHKQDKLAPRDNLRMPRELDPHAASVRTQEINSAGELPALQHGSPFVRGRERTIDDELVHVPPDQIGTPIPQHL